jgi:LPXTG-motif cell wall-anchored protein
MWIPPTQGEYTIIATFSGSDSYGSSYAETAIGVTEAPSPAVLPTSTPSPTITPTVAPTATASPSPVPNTGSTLGTEVYIAIAATAVIAIIAAAALVLRKRK